MGNYIKKVILDINHIAFLSFAGLPYVLFAVLFYFGNRSEFAETWPILSSLSFTILGILAVVIGYFIILFINPNKFIVKRSEKELDERKMLHKKYAYIWPVLFLISIVTALILIIIGFN